MSIVLTGRRGKALVQPADIDDPGRVFAVAEAIRAAFGRLDVLVNNAGTNIPDRSWHG